MMRRAGLLQLALLTFVLASDMTEWRWFEVDDCPASAAAGPDCAGAYPIALRLRVAILDQIAIPPTMFLHDAGVEPESIHAFFDAGARANSGTFPGVALVYSHMSLQR
jgi:hypothetical protein